jgi:hypothetical protein
MELLAVGTGDTLTSMAGLASASGDRQTHARTKTQLDFLFFFLFFANRVCLLKTFR